MKELMRQTRRGVAQPDIAHIEELAYHAAIAEYDEKYRGQFERTFGRRNRVTFARIGMRPDDDLGVYSHNTGAALLPLVSDSYLTPEQLRGTPSRVWTCLSRKRAKSCLRTDSSCSGRRRRRTQPT